MMCGMAVQRGFPSCGLDQVQQDLEERRLARPVRPHERKNLPLPDVERSAFERLHAALSAVDLLQVRDTASGGGFGRDGDRTFY